MTVFRTGVSGGVGGVLAPSSGYTYTLRYPVTLGVGDLIVLAVLTRPQVATTAPPRPGWTLAEQAPVGASWWYQLWWKKAQASDVAAKGTQSVLVINETYAISTWQSGTYNQDRPLLDSSYKFPPAPYYNAIYTTPPVGLASGSPVVSVALAISGTTSSYHWVPVYGQLLVDTSVAASGGQRGGAAGLSTRTLEGSPSFVEQWKYNDTGASAVSVSVAASYVVNEAPGIAHQGGIYASRQIIWGLTRNAYPLAPADGARVQQHAYPLSALLNSRSGPCDVRFTVTNAAAGYTEIGVLTAQPNGRVAWTPTSPPLGLPLSWQVEVGNASSWDYPSTNMLTYVLGSGDGDSAEAMTTNVAVPYVETRVTAEEMTANVTSTTPKPHLWSVSLPSGRAGDQLTLFGRGLGVSAATLHTQIKADYGPNYAGTPDGVMPVFTWTTIPGTDDGPGRSIKAGASPSATIEHDVVVVTAPIDYMPASNAPDAPIYLYASGDGGISNRLSWLAYANRPYSVTMVSRLLRSNIAVRLLSPPTGPGGIEQRHAAFLPTYVVESGVAQRPPLYGALTSSRAVLGSWSTPAPSGSIPGLAGDRYRPDLSSLVAAPDIGTDTSQWFPSENVQGSRFVVHVPNAPYVVPGYPVASRMGVRPESAMVFDSTAYAENRYYFRGGFSLYLTVQLHAVANVGAQPLVLVSFYNGFVPLDNVTNLELVGSTLQVVTRNRGAVIAVNKVPAITRALASLTAQPILLGLVVSPAGGVRLFVGDKVMTTQTGLTSVPWMQATGPTSGGFGNVRLARGTSIDAGTVYGSMDIIDMVFTIATAVDTATESARILSAMDGLHGILRR